LFKPALSLLVKRKAAFVLSKGARVIVTAAIYQTGRMFNVKHLVVEDVLDEPFRHVCGVESLAYRDAVINVIVMTEDIPCAPL
jgi:hypothetical protein